MGSVSVDEGGYVEITRVGTFTLGWGESLVWDDRRERLYFVDCAAQSIHWLDPGVDDPATLVAPSMPAGLVPTTDGLLVVALHDGLHLVDPDAGTFEVLTPYPEGLGERANDACADLAGSLITGTLNLGPGPGSAWRFSSSVGWSLIDGDIANTNGPAAAVLGGRPTLIIGDTSAVYWAYDYDDAAGSVGPRRVFGDTGPLEGAPDGATFDGQEGLWCALFGGAQLARFTSDGLDQTIGVPVANPTDVTFGGPQLDRLYLVSVAGAGDLDGSLLVIDGVGRTGRAEPRFAR